MKRFFSITCPMYRNDQPVRMPLGIAKIYYDMPQRIAHRATRPRTIHPSGHPPLRLDRTRRVQRLRRGLPVVNDLQGRRVAQPAKGLYIVNGKKVVIK